MMLWKAVSLLTLVYILSSKYYICFRISQKKKVGVKKTFSITYTALDYLICDQIPLLITRANVVQLQGNFFLQYNVGYSTIEFQFFLFFIFDFTILNLHFARQTFFISRISRNSKRCSISAICCFFITMLVIRRQRFSLF